MRKLLLIVALAGSGSAAAAEATYLANAGVLVTAGDTKILFDPLFRNSYDRYLLVPSEMEAAMFSGTPPFDGIDAVFVSHRHGDHFSAADVLAYLEAMPDVVFVAPAQAARQVVELADAADEQLTKRIHGLDVPYGEAAVAMSTGALTIAAFRIPHAGWPDRMTDVENLAFRVTLADDATVVHLGDADTRDEHFDKNAERWASLQIDAAFPPYWYFTSESGRAVLEQRLKPALAIGVHMPGELEPEYAVGLEGNDVFRTPGETRRIPAANAE